MRPVLGVLLACCLGAVPVGLLLPRPVSARWLQCRLFGRWDCRGVTVFALEMVLGVLAVWAAAKAGTPSTRGEVMLLAVTMGSLLPLRLGFQAEGGTGLFFGAIVAISGLAGAGTLLVCVCLLAFTRSAGISAALAAACYPAGLWLLEHPGPMGLTCAGAAAGLVVWRHRKALRPA